MDFTEGLKNQILEDYNESYTENGAKGYKTTGKALLDLNFSVASLRSVSDTEVINKFMLAYYENPALAITWLFYARDIREGLGERRLFRTCIKHIIKTEKLYAEEFINLVLNKIAEMGRYDDIYFLLDIDPTIDRTVADFIKAQLNKDVADMKDGKSISLISKWLKSEKASNEESRKLAKATARALGMSSKEYRQTLSSLRKYLDVTEVKMCAKYWTEIDYSKVPSKAGLNYKEAFMRHDERRYIKFIDKAAKGEVKINSGALYPHEIVNNYMVGYYRSDVSDTIDNTLEAMWKQLPDTVKGNGNTLVVADGSGSMTCNIGNGRTTALNVANALAIYFAERASGIYKNKYITFSERPQFVDFSNCNNLRDKIELALNYNEVANTNIEAVFDLILNTAINNNCAQEEMPANILILSDMEFDHAIDCSIDETLFETIRKKYEDAGYKLPRLIFWNLASRTGTIPVRENESGVALVSGFSSNIVKMVMENETDPYKLLLKVLLSERYKDIYETTRQHILLSMWCYLEKITKEITKNIV